MQLDWAHSSSYCIFLSSKISAAEWDGCPFYAVLVIVATFQISAAAELCRFRLTSGQTRPLVVYLSGHAGGRADRKHNGTPGNREKAKAVLGNFLQLSNNSGRNNFFRSFLFCCLSALCYIHGVDSPCSSVSLYQRHFLFAFLAQPKQGKRRNLLYSHRRLSQDMKSPPRPILLNKQSRCKRQSLSQPPCL